MKIALFISSLQCGGAERALSELANYWSTKGHEVHLYLFSGKEVPYFYTLNSRVCCHALSVMTPENASFLKRYAHLLKRVFRLRNVIKKESPDFILSFMDMVNIQVILASLGLGKRVVVCERTNPFLRKLPLSFTYLRKFLYKKVKLVVQTNNILKFFHDLNRENVFVIPNVIRKLASPKLSAKKSQKILFLGRLTHEKGGDLLIKAFATLHHEFPGYHLDLYGEGSEKEAFEVLIEKYGLEKKAFLKGATSEVENVLQKGDIFVLPSRFEGFPNALAEALAMGLPCLASNTMGCTDLIQDGENGLLFESENIDSLQNRLRELLLDRDLQMRLSKRAIEVRERLAPENIYPLWDALLPEDPMVKKK